MVGDDVGEAAAFVRVSDSTSQALVTSPGGRGRPGAAAPMMAGALAVTLTV